MFKRFLVIATLAAGLISTQVSAAFLSTDWKVTNDKKAVLDTDTGIEWLSLTVTDSLSINTVTSRLDTQYQGWRLPTHSEVYNMLSNFFNMQSPEGGNGSTSLSLVTSFSNLFGLVHQTSTKNSSAFHLDSQGRVAQSGVYYGSGFNLVYFGGRGDNANMNTSIAYRAVYLVSDGGTTLSSINNPKLNINNPNAPINMADVSAPAGLAAAGVLMLVFGVRRKTA